MMDSTERQLLAATIGDALANTAGAPCDALLHDLGWHDMLATEPVAAIDIVFRALGTSAAHATALDDVLQHALGRAPNGDVVVLLPRFASWEPPGRAGGDRIIASGMASSRVAAAREILVVSATPEGLGLGHVAVEAAVVGAAHGVDPGRLRSVEVDTVAVPSESIADETWGAAVALAQRAAAAEIAGACRTMLDLACAHARERVQFGRPIARFQAVRHRLADAFVAIEALDSCIAAAADEPGAMTAALAKAVAGRTAEIVMEQCQQVLAGIGFTTDHPFHNFAKRSMVLAGLFGSAEAITLDLGRQLVVARRVPTLVEL